MLRQRHGHGVTIAYRHLGPKYRLLTQSSAYVGAELARPRSPEDLVLLEPENSTGGPPTPT
jgi:hypothetical protein